MITGGRISRATKVTDKSSGVLPEAGDRAIKQIGCYYYIRTSLLSLAMDDSALDSNSLLFLNFEATS